ALIAWARENRWKEEDSAQFCPPAPVVFPHTPWGYRAFLQQKIKVAPAHGFTIDPASVNRNLKDHCRAIVPWALAGGRRAIFAAFGLHKTSMQLEIMRHVGLRTGRPTLIVLPLDVRHEFFAEHEERGFAALGMKLKFIRTTAEIEDANVTHLTNYE